MSTNKDLEPLKYAWIRQVAQQEWVRSVDAYADATSKHLNKQRTGTCNVNMQETLPDITGFVMEWRPDSSTAD